MTRPISDSSSSERLWACPKAGSERFSAFAQRRSVAIFSSKSPSAHGAGLDDFAARLVMLGTKKAVLVRIVE